MTLADTPTTWESPPPTSTLEALLFFVGIPVLILAVITLLVMAPSLAKGPRYRPGQDWDAEPEWFGSAPTGSSTSPSPAHRRVEAAAVAPRRQATDPTDDRLRGDDDETGGASVRW